MALQGTIDAFPIPDVLRLLGSSQKSGELTVTGTHSSCAVWIGSGTIFGGTTTRSSVIPPVLAVFETLRIEDGSFEFTSLDVKDLPDAGFDPVPTETAITEAEALSEQWVKIQEVVPSLDHELKLAPQLPTERIAVDQDMWELITNIGMSTSVGDLAVVLEIGEFEICARTSALIEAGLLTISEPRILNIKKDTTEVPGTAKNQERTVDVGQIAPSSNGVHHGETNTSLRGAMTAEDTADAAATDFPDKFPIDDLVNEDESDAKSHWDSLAATTTGEAPEAEPESPFDTFSSFANDDYLEFEAIDDAEEFTPEIEVMPLGDLSSAEEASAGPHVESGDSTDEVLRQMSKLSPQAAEAIAAAMRPSLGGLDPRSEDPVHDDEITFLDTL